MCGSGAVDDEGEVMDMSVQKRRDAEAALRFFRQCAEERSVPTARWRGHPLGRACERLGIGSPRPIALDQRSGRRHEPDVQGAAVRRYHYETQGLAAHLSVFHDACNFARRFKTLAGLAPYEPICNAWTEDLDRSRFDPTHLMAGLNT